MEEQIEEKLQKYYNDKMHIECRYKEIRVYTIYIEIMADVREFDYIWDAHFTESSNIESIIALINKEICKIFKR